MATKALEINGINVAAEGEGAVETRINGGDLTAILHHPLLDAQSIVVWVDYGSRGFGGDIPVTKQAVYRHFTYSTGDNANEKVKVALFAVGGGKFGIRIG